MKKIIYTFIACLSLSIAKGQISPMYEGQFQYLLDSICNKEKIKGVSAAIFRPGEGVWEGTYGESHTGVSITADMYFPIGSNTKTFVAAALLKLQEKGVLSIEDTIGKWIQHPNIDGKITVKQLLNHTSGLYNYMGDYDFLVALNDDYARTWQQDDMLQFIKAPVNAPGAVWQYCNTNYLLAGIIISKATGQSLEVALRELVLKPANLSETFLFPHEKPNANIPHGWSAGITTYKLADMHQEIGYVNNAFLSMAAGAGGMISTARDNVKFWNALMSGKIINAASLNAMKQLTTTSGADPYGLGLYQWPANGHTIYNHSGTCFAFLHENLYDSESGIAVSVLTNQDSVDNNMMFAAVVYALHRMALDMPALNIAKSPVQDMMLRIFPNPVANDLRISSTEKMTAIEIFDMSGSNVIACRLDEVTKYGINVSHLPEGLYTVRVITKQRCTTQKLKIKR